MVNLFPSCQPPHSYLWAILPTFLKTTVPLPDQSDWILPLYAISQRITFPLPTWLQLEFPVELPRSLWLHSGRGTMGWDGMGGQRLEAEHRCTGRGEWGGLDVGQSQMEKISLLASSPIFSRGRRLSHGQIFWGLRLLLKPACCLSSNNENIISKKGHSPWRHRMIMGDIYLSKCEAQPWRSEWKEHRFLLLVNFMVDLTVFK